MKVKALLFVIFTIFLFALGILVTTLFNSAPTAPDAVAMFYASLFLALFGLIFFIMLIVMYLKTKVTPGFSTLKTLVGLVLTADALLIALLVLKANEILNWATSIVLALLAVITSVVLKRRIN